MTVPVTVRRVRSDDGTPRVLLITEHGMEVLSTNDAIQIGHTLIAAAGGGESET